MLASASIVSARDQLVVCSLSDLLVEYGFGTTELGGLKVVLQALDHFEVQLDPDFQSSDDLRLTRTLKKKRSSPALNLRIRDMIESGGENYSVELKSSISIDTKRKKFDPGKNINTYVNDKLALKLAQEICAFLNREGGTVYLGIANDLSILGCEDDFAAHPGDGTPEDKADLIIHAIVEKYCVKPNIICSHLQVQCTNYEGKYVVLIEINPMSQLAFLKKNSGASSEFYMRIGTSAQPIGFCDVEDYFTVQRMTSK